MRPGSEAELAELVAGLDRPVAVRGGGTRSPAADVVLETGGLSGIELYEPGALTLVVKAGTPVAEVESVLAAEGQMLAFEPFDLSGITGVAGPGTMGGVVATNASGPRRFRVGAARDFLLGVRFVDGRGQVISNGGRVMKNVTGYDLVKLMAGSRGTLGVLTELSFKVLPRPDASATLVLEGLDDAAAVRCLSAATGSPFEVTGALHLGDGLAGGPLTALRIEGFEGSVAYRAERLAAVLGPFGAAEIQRDAEIWDDMRGLGPFRGADAALWFLSIKPSEAPGLVERVLKPAGARHAFDWAGGRVIIQASEGTEALHHALQAECARIGGHATLMHGPGLVGHVPVLQPEAAPVDALSAGLRRKFDPRGVFAPMGAA